MSASVPESQRGENDFTLSIKAESLAEYTLNITKNNKVFDTEIHPKLVSDIVEHAVNAYIDIRNANDVKVEDYKTYRNRKSLQESAIKHLKNLLWEMQLARRVFHLSAKRMRYWSAQVVEIRDRTRAWMNKEAKVYSSGL